jgi:hypothetical protein
LIFCGEERVRERERERKREREMPGYRNPFFCRLKSTRDHKTLVDDLGALPPKSDKYSKKQWSRLRCFRIVPASFQHFWRWPGVTDNIAAGWIVAQKNT